MTPDGAPWVSTRFERTSQTAGIVSGAMPVLRRRFNTLEKK
jgi:hypothetical protein